MDGETDASSPAPDSDGLTAIRSACRSLHDRLDQRIGSLDLGNRRDYITFLQLHHAALAEAMPAIRAACPAAPDRMAQIEADLAALGAAPSGPAARPLDIGPSAGAMLGLLYVIEGSRKGAAVLLRRVGDGFPSSYLADRGAALPWKVLARNLSQMQPDICQDAVDQAARTFRHFIAVGETLIGQPFHPINENA